MEMTFLKNLYFRFMLIAGFCWPHLFRLLINPRKLSHSLSSIISNMCRDLVTDLLLNKNLAAYYETLNITGACIAVKMKNNLEGEDLFDPKFFMYYEDADLCERAIEFQNKIVLVPGAFFYHQHSNTTNISDALKINAWKSVSEKYYKLKREGIKRESRRSLRHIYRPDF